MNDDLAAVCNLLALAAIPSRLKVLRCLVHGPQEIKVLMEATGVSGTAMAQQLDLMRSAKVVEAGSVSGRFVYRLTEAGRALVESVSVLAGRVA